MTTSPSEPSPNDGSGRAATPAGGFPIGLDLCLVPIGAGLSLADYIAECQRCFEDHGLTPRLGPFGTSVEGDWDRVMPALRACHERVHAMGAARILSTVKLASRTDKAESLDEKIVSVAQAKEKAGG